MAQIIKARYRLRSGTTAQWAANDEVLGAGEVGEEVTTDGRRLRKTGNGVDTFSTLPYRINYAVDESVSPADKQVLTYDVTSGLWLPKDSTGGGGGDQFAVASGTDTITATFPTTPTLADGLQFKVRAAGANTTTTPTFNPNGLGALPLTKFGGIALAASDIYGAGDEIIIRYVSSVPRYELVTPAVLPGGVPSPAAWIAPTLVNSWENYGSPYSTAGYYKDQIGVVHLRGTLKSGTAGTMAFTLPAGYRPGATGIFSAFCSTGMQRVDIATDGTVLIRGSPTIGLDGLTFRAEA